MENHSSKIASENRASKMKESYKNALKAHNVTLFLNKHNITQNRIYFPLKSINNTGYAVSLKFLRQSV